MKAFISIIVFLFLITGAWYLVQYIQSHAPSDIAAGTLIASVSYACNDDKSITAAYYDGPGMPAAGEGLPPTPGGSVRLVLSDGRSFTLPQTISASGVRYANADESFVFWNKGRGATATEIGKSPYTCIEIAEDTEGLPLVYASTEKGFSTRYPANFIADASYTYQMGGPDMDIEGVKFTIDPSIAKGTNLSKDSYVSVEQIPGETLCTAEAFVFTINNTLTATEDGITYSYATSSDAGVGNRYDQIVYAIPGTNPCVAVRYFIHSTAIGNYPEGTVTEFNRDALVAQFDAVRRSLIIGQ